MRKIFHLLISPAWRWTTLLVFIVMGVMIRLGFWQLDRHVQRKDFIAHVGSIVGSPELNLSGDISSVDLPSNEYRKIKATGYFDYDHQIALRNQVWVQPWGIDPGFSLFAPFIMTNGSKVLVQRGWIPLEYNNPELWREFNKSGEISIHGVIRNPVAEDVMGGGVPDPTYSPGETMSYFWNNIDIDQLRQLLPYELLPIYVQQSSDPLLVNLPYAMIPEVDLSEGAHLGYALQWFTYTLLILIGYPIFLSKRSNVLPENHEN